ncbi:MAG: Gfo/Idh/MocA family protein [Verrucomicrobiales bacterium]|nr:Gfo/Idh/MocA family oxidoreductase [Verrucomicrobiae bacterium]MCP5554309.1 Gfo/Idh/MocA family oxidoreductase [Akkermansiaceae bacterium]
MSHETTPHSPSSVGSDPLTNRRKFITGAAAVAGAAALPIELSAQVAGSDEIKVGLIGCGGRGSGAAAQTLTVDGCRLIAVADAFQDRLDGGLNNIKGGMEKAGRGDRVAVTDKKYVGLDAYKELIDNVDLVLVATPPGFRPIHFEYAVNAGKHVFMEKPVCVDAWGYNKIVKAAQAADEKGLKVVVGLQRHYQNVYREAFKKVHEEGMIGDIVSAQAWWNGSRPWIRERKPGQTEMEYQIMNWYHFAWLSGDHISEQHVHNIDVINWFVSGNSEKGGHPVTAQGLGGRCTREPLSVGEIFDHHFVEFRYENGVILNSQCRHAKGAMPKVAEEIQGTEGTLYLQNGKIVDRKGATKWEYRERNAPNPYQVEHDELHAAIRNKTPLNNAYYGANSSFTSALGRIATYSGQQVSWDEAVKSDFNIGPKDYAFDAEAPVKPDANGNYALPIPGETKVPWKA